MQPLAPFRDDMTPTVGRHFDPTWTVEQNKTGTEPDPVPWTLGWVTRPWAWPQARVGGVVRVG